MLASAQVIHHRTGRMAAAGAASQCHSTELSPFEMPRSSNVGVKVRVSTKASSGLDRARLRKSWVQAVSLYVRNRAQGDRADRFGRFPEDVRPCNVERWICAAVA